MTERRPRGIAAALVIALTLLLCAPSSANAAGPGAPTVNRTPTTILASRLSLSGLSYSGVVDVPVLKGEVKAMKFGLSGLRMDDVQVSLPQSDGRALRMSGRYADLDTALFARSTMYVRQLKGHLKLGPVKIPVDFTPENPPPLTFPWVLFTDVTIGLYALDGGDLSVPDAKLLVDQPHLPLPAPTDTPNPPLEGEPAPGEDGEDEPAEKPAASPSADEPANGAG